MQDLLQNIRDFTRERDWEQFHSPKNLAMALSVEIAEIVEIFQWLTEDESRRLDDGKRAELSDEIGDVVIYLMNLADKLDIDPIGAARRKLEKNKEKYPAHQVKGKSLKYDQY
jgi:dCTP diphosphatase